MLLKRSEEGRDSREVERKLLHRAQRNTTNILDGSIISVIHLSLGGASDKIRAIQ